MKTLFARIKNAIFPPKVESLSDAAFEVAHARNLVLSGIIIPTRIGEFEGCPMFLQDTYVHAYIAIPPSVPGVMFCTDGTIVANQAFLNAPESVKNASLLHELGHITLGHQGYNRQDQVLFLEGKGRIVEDDMAADKFAVSKGADIVSALEFYLQFDAVAPIPVQVRIKALQN